MELKKKSIDKHTINPLLGYLAMFVTQDIVIKVFFSEINILNKSFSIPKNSTIILAPTHRSRWDGLVLTKAIGRRVTKKDCRFMVTKSEMKGIQGWFQKDLVVFQLINYPISFSIKICCQSHT